MPKDARKKNNKEIIEISAEQFARLFWKQCLYKKEPERPKFHEHQTNKNENRSPSSFL